MIQQATQEDFDFIYGLYMHPLVNPYLLYEPMDKESFQPIYDELLQKNIKYLYTDGSNRVGMVKLMPYTHRAGHVGYVGGLAIHPDFSARGHGKKMMEELLEMAAAKKLRRLELSVDVINDKAIRLYEKVGFYREGILKQYTYLAQEDKYLDEVLMAYLFE